MIHKPNISTPPVPDKDTIDSLKKKSKKELKESRAYQKYILPTVSEDKRKKREQLQSWWWSKGITILNIILSLIAAITGAVSLLLQLYWR